LSSTQAAAVGLTTSYTTSEQAFMTDLVATFISNTVLYPIFTSILPDLGANLFDARYTNSVPLAFVFTTQSGEPYRMDEFYLSFFDFDQDYADGPYGFVRENLLVYDFTTVYLEGESEIERRYTRDVSIFAGTGIPIRTISEQATGGCPNGGYYRVASGPQAGEYRACADTVSLPAIVMRSSREGTGLPQVTKYAKERCAGYCSRNQGSEGKGPLSNGLMVGATCSANRGNPQQNDVPLGSAQNLFAQQCSNLPITSYPLTCSASPFGGGTSGLSPTFTWTGCGFSDSGSFGVTASGTGPDIVAGGGYEAYQVGASIACELDCPRVYPIRTSADDPFLRDWTAPNNNNCNSAELTTPITGQSSCDDAGNPTDILCLSNQQKRRAATFLFRNQWRVTIQFRTEVGGKAIVNPNNDLFNTLPPPGTSVHNFPDLGPSDYGMYGAGLSRLGAVSPAPVKFSPAANFMVPFCSSITDSSPNCLSLSSTAEDRAQYNPDLARLSLGTPQDPKGRNFLFGGSSSLLNPPPSPPCLLCRCDNSCAFASNGICDDGRVGSFTSLCPAPVFVNDPVYQSGVGTTDCEDCGPATDCSPPPPECYPPPPPPPPVTTTTCTACLDPHLTFAHGGRADFKGKDKVWYPMLSARNVTMNTFFVHDDFKNPNKIVHGSAMKAAAWVLRTNDTGTVITVEYNASSAGRPAAYVKASDSPVGVWVSHGQKPFIMENIAIQLRERKLSGVGKKSFHGVALVVETGLWQMSVWSKPYPNAAANPGKALLNIHVEALYDADLDPVAPHGLIGQSYDGDAAPVDGELDDYKGKEVTTKAMAEGALEGDASDYELRHKFATRFAYSRFDATAAKHRDVSKLAVKKDAKPRKEAFAGTATADLEDDEA